MSALTIDIQDNQTAFVPGQTVRGQVQWTVESTPKQASLQLLWYTVGKGTEDTGLVESMGFADPSASDSRSYEFKIPVGPYSFSGQLISLVWTLELVIGKQFVRQDITIGPEGREIILYRPNL